jgi:hypothetical protein
MSIQIEQILTEKNDENQEKEKIEENPLKMREKSQHSIKIDKMVKKAKIEKKQKLSDEKKFRKKMIKKMVKERTNDFIENIEK